MSVSADRGMRLTLLTFAGQQSCQVLEQGLAGLGYSIDVLCGDEWLAAAPERRIAPDVLFFGLARHPRETFEAILERMRGRPWLCVFRNDAPLLDTRLLEQCTEFLTWPWHEKELLVRLDRFCGCLARSSGGAAENDLREDFASLNIIGRSPAFLEVLRAVRRISRFGAPALLQGETGTGKELVARAIHYLGPRHDRPFIPVNCGAIPDNLVENEFFGHERGAFTDAKEAQSGLVAQADGGTLFLDEVETLSPKAQVCLLRFLQDQEFRPLGGKRTRRVDVRVIAATNRALDDIVERDAFRSDLYFRLNVVALDLPPLCQRPDDIELLADHFLRLYRTKYNEPRKVLGPPTLRWMKSYDWPGNVRELENFIHRGVVASEGAIIPPPGSHGAAEAGAGQADAHQGFETFNRAKAEVIERFERQYLSALLAETGGNVTQAAKRAGKERRALGKLLKKHGIVRDDP